MRKNAENGQSLDGMQEVSGSIPLGSTIHSRPIPVLLTLPTPSRLQERDEVASEIGMGEAVEVK